MTKVIFQTSMSLDGFIRGPHPTHNEPLGVDGERLHAWGEDPAGSEVAAEKNERTGALMAGRTTYEDSLPFWGADGPSGPARISVFVVSHDVPSDVPEDGVYRFVTDGLQSAIAKATEAAAGKDVMVIGGANIGQQLIRGRLVDELYVHLVPLVFGDGLRMFDNLGEELRAFEIASVRSGPQATHLRYRLTGDGGTA